MDEKVVTYVKEPRKVELRIIEARYGWAVNLWEKPCSLENGSKDVTDLVKVMVSPDKKSLHINPKKEGQWMNKTFWPETAEAPPVARHISVVFAWDHTGYLLCKTSARVPHETTDLLINTSTTDCEPFQCDPLEIVAARYGSGSDLWHRDCSSGTDCRDVTQQVQSMVKGGILHINPKREAQFMENAFQSENAGETAVSSGPRRLSVVYVWGTLSCPLLMKTSAITATGNADLLIAPGTGGIPVVSGPDATLNLRAARYGWAEDLWAEARCSHANGCKDVLTEVKQLADGNIVVINPRCEGQWMNKTFWPETARGPSIPRHVSVEYDWGIGPVVYRKTSQKVMHETTSLHIIPHPFDIS